MRWPMRQRTKRPSLPVMTRSAAAAAERDAAMRRAQTQAATANPLSYARSRKVGRNEPCWCGSGKKFKQCHGKLN